MTAIGDVIIGGASGAPVRLAAGSDNRVLTMIAGSPSWQPAGGFSNPMIAAGDLIIGGTSGAAARLAVGAVGQVLMSGATPSWQPLPVDPGFANPMTQIGDLIVGGTAGAATRMAAVATGAVFTSAGVGTAPTWSASPAVTDLKLGPSAAIGTSGVGVLALGSSTAPTTSPVDTVQLYTQDLGGEAGSRALTIRDERGNITQIGTITVSGLFLRQTVGTTDLHIQNDGAATWIGSSTNHNVNFMQNNLQRIQLGVDANIYVWLPGLAAKNIAYGGPDSAGAGYRLLRITN
jgi:hypothetical protein